MVWCSDRGWYTWGGGCGFKSCWPRWRTILREKCHDLLVGPPLGEKNFSRYFWPFFRDFWLDFINSVNLFVTAAKVAEKNHLYKPLIYRDGVTGAGDKTAPTKGYQSSLGSFSVVVTSSVTMSSAFMMLFPSQVKLSCLATAGSCGSRRRASSGHRWTVLIKCTGTRTSLSSGSTSSCSCRGERCLDPWLLWLHLRHAQHGQSPQASCRAGKQLASHAALAACCRDEHVHQQGRDPCCWVSQATWASLCSSCSN